MDDLGGFPNIFGGPLPAISGVITPMSRVFSTHLPIYKAIYRGYNSICN